MIQYISTRGGCEPQGFETVLLSGLARDGGLYVPAEWPQIDLNALKGKNYCDIAHAVMYPFVQGHIDSDTFYKLIQDTYNIEYFDDKDVVPVRSLYKNIHLLELFHGPTIAFKDVALQLLGRLFSYTLEKHDERVVVVGATSGDTGSAAIEGCRHTDKADVFILHPKGRVSEVQRRQMTTVDAPNVHNIALEGTFDDCQDLVKAMFNDPSFRADMNLSAVNSINWARIMAQIVYYFTAAEKLGFPEEGITFVVPTGNFGNIFAAYAAKQMGLPIKKLVVATNRNDILTRFFESGVMEPEVVFPTVSPSMDIQISSNFERYLFDLFDRDADMLRAVMEGFKRTGKFHVSQEDLRRVRNIFDAKRANDRETLNAIRFIHEKTGYVMDPHTAVGMHAALKIAKEEKGPIVSLACAHPAKFPDAVKDAVDVFPALPEYLSDLLEREEHFDVLPNNLQVVQDFIRKNRS